MARGKKIYEGKAKTLYEGPEPGTIIQYFKDDATAFNAVKKDTLDGKGALNNLLCEHFMLGLNTIGLPTHFIRRLNVREQLVHKVEIVPLEIIVRNVAAGSFSKMFNIEEGTPLPRPIVEFSEEHILAMNWASSNEIDDMREIALRVNDFLAGLMYGIGIKLVDFKIEVGRQFEDDLRDKSEIRQRCIPQRSRKFNRCIFRSS